MKRNRGRGFTLVEMLVVIGIIAALAGLILPAVFGSREAVNEATCKAQMRDMAKAMLAHESQRKHFPGYGKLIATEAGGSVEVGIIPQLFPFMERPQEYRAIIEGKPESRWKQHYDEFVCKSSNPDLGVALEGSPTEDPNLDFPFSYAINCGRDDNTASVADDRNTAIGHDHRVPKASRIKVNLDDIGDGQTQTILLAENLDLANWTTTGNAIEFLQGVIFEEGTIAADSVPFHVNPVAKTVALTAANARPSSYHRGGNFNVAYAGGNVETFEVDETEPHISYRLFRAQMTPNCDDDVADETWSCGSSSSSSGSGS